VTNTIQGTAEFMSTDMLNAMASDRPYHQGVLDDVEAFVNVAFWAVLFNLNFPGKSNDEDVWREKLRSPSHHVRDGAQTVITKVSDDETLSEGSDDGLSVSDDDDEDDDEGQAQVLKIVDPQSELSELLEVFRPLLRDWRKRLADRSKRRSQVKRWTDSKEQILAVKLVDDFAKLLLKHSQNLMRIGERSI